MYTSQRDIITQLQKDIFRLHECKTILNSTSVDVELGAIKNAFPNNTFPLGAIHEFIAATEDNAVTGGFVATILASLMPARGATIWIGSNRAIFPPALKLFGISPDKIIFIDLQKEKEILWAIEEALKCKGVAAVVGEMQELSFTASRRLQLAVEQSRVTGFILRQNPRNLNTTACVTRWKITSLPSELADNMPGVGFPRWNVELLKVRNGRPGAWQVEITAGKLRHIYKIVSLSQLQKKKAG
ncbi:MAG: Error-prone repair protein ImuA [Ginsengibacter sp.]